MCHATSAANLDTNHIYPGSNVRAPQCKPPVYLPYPAGESSTARSSQSDGESRRCLDWPSALAAILTTRVQGSTTMMSTMEQLSSRTMTTAIAIPPEQSHHPLHRIRIGRPPPLPPHTPSLILRAATATATATTTPLVEADKGGAELDALPCLAFCVEVAMCRFQLDVALPPSYSEKVGESTPPPSLDCILRKAVGTMSYQLS
jgi:hypothetical protein